MSAPAGSDNHPLNPNAVPQINVHQPTSNTTNLTPRQPNPPALHQISPYAAYDILEQIDVVNREAIRIAKRLQENRETAIKPIVQRHKAWKEGIANETIDKAATPQPTLTNDEREMIEAYRADAPAISKLADPALARRTLDLPLGCIRPRTLLKSNLVAPPLPSTFKTPIQSTSKLSHPTTASFSPGDISRDNFHISTTPADYCMFEAPVPKEFCVDAASGCMKMLQEYATNPPKTVKDPRPEANKNATVCDFNWPNQWSLSIEDFHHAVPRFLNIIDYAFRRHFPNAAKAWRGILDLILHNTELAQEFLYWLSAYMAQCTIHLQCLG
ncbi:hypothetical protein FRB96_001095 [Tulasnella sp. 330]|nr:hypothetical protein FRB96_001095 [Tulasnella sp. 330]KAG8870113.1 hypothetical protein FRB97_000312 [Tulasnella sp. 331]KAG8872140.1 hypothetical protein FRB98_000260 [Tulasnella sp. 332]